MHFSPTTKKKHMKQIEIEYEQSLKNKFDIFSLHGLVDGNLNCNRAGRA